MNYGVYAIRNTSNGKCYVGSTGKLTIRWGQHKYDLTRGRHFNPHLQNAWNKYGEESFVYEVLEHCSKEDLLLREEQWITYLQSYKDANGYNLCKTPRASRLGCKASEKTIAKMKVALSGEKHPMWGKHLKDITRKKISKAQLGIAKPSSGAKKEYMLVSPTGNQTIVRGLREFCRTNNLPLSIMWRVVNGKKDEYKGWKLCQIFT